MDLPSVIPIFPLPNAVLFPGIPLPLHIFEPRYREMVKDAAEHDRLIGMVLLRGEWRSQYYDRPQVFDTGCAGKLIHVELLPDGRSNILLEGMREFDIRGHRFDRPYRRAEVSWWPSDPGERLPAELEQRLVARVQTLLGREGKESTDERLVSELSHQQLVGYFCSVLGFSPMEKQGLLQERSLPARALRLAEMVEFRLADLAASAPSSGRQH